jgi:outer membrane protein TolC
MAGIVAGCASFKPEPISAADNAAALDSRSLDDARLKTFIAAIRQTGAPPASAPDWDLGTLSLAALYFHPELDVARARLAGARAAVTTAGQIPNPVLSFSGTYAVLTDMPSPWTVGPIVNFLIETFGKRQYRTAEAKALAEAAREALASASWQVRGRVRTALIALWAADRRADLMKDRLVLQEELANLLERRFAAGAASSLDVSRERINRDQISLALRDAERQRAEARVALATSIGLPSRALEGVKLDLGALEGPAQGQANAVTALGDLRREALTHRSDVQGLLADYEAAQANLQLKLAGQYPNLTLGPGYTYDQSQDKIRLDLAIELPIFNQHQGQIAEAAARRQEIAARFTALQAGIIGAIDEAWAGLRAANETVARADTLLANAERRQQQFARSFQAGQVDRPAMVTSQLEVAAIRLSRLDALVRQRQALGALEDALQHPLLDPAPWPSGIEQSPRAAAKGNAA